MNHIKYKAMTVTIRSMLMPVVATLLCVAQIAAEDAVIVNPGVVVSAIDEDSMRDLFLGRKTAWDDGSRVVVVVLKDGVSHDALLRVLGKNSQQFLTSWKKLVFTGKGAMPEQVDSEDKLLALIAKTPGAIGFIDKGKITGGVKAVTK